jgi:hypothetical protein
VHSDVVILYHTQRNLSLLRQVFNTGCPHRGVHATSPEFRQCPGRLNYASPICLWINAIIVERPPERLKALGLQTMNQIDIIEWIFIQVYLGNIVILLG